MATCLEPTLPLLGVIPRVGGLEMVTSLFFKVLYLFIQIFPGECFLFSIQPKMAIFHSTGKDENLQMLSDELLALGGQPGKEEWNK